MKVFIVIRSVDYEDSHILHVVDSEQTAKSLVLNYAFDESHRRGGIQKLDDLPHGYKVGDTCLLYEIWEVETKRSVM